MMKIEAIERRSPALVTMTTVTAHPSPSSLPPVLWRDPHRVPAGELSAYIGRLERACLEHPTSVDLRTCLGMAHAMNYDVYRSLDALEEARAIDGTNFWAQMKYAELHYRLRTLVRAEKETLRALELAETPGQFGMARRQLQEVRRLAREGTRNITFDKPLGPPAAALAVLIAALCGVMLW
jgi:hypothetical protein